MKHMLIILLVTTMVLSFAIPSFAIVDLFPAAPEFEPNRNYDIWTVVEYNIKEIQADLVCTVSAKRDFCEFYLECNFYGDDQMTHTIWDGEKYVVLEDATGFMAGDTPAILNKALAQNIWLEIDQIPNDELSYHIHVESSQYGNTSISANGELNNNSAKPGSIILISAMPNEGCILRSILIEYNGTTHTLSDNKFTMPSSNVRIIVKYEKEDNGQSRTNEANWKAFSGIYVSANNLPIKPEFAPHNGYDIYTVVEYTIQEIQADLVCTVSAKKDLSEFYLECNFYGDDQMTRTVCDGRNYTILEDKTGFMSLDTPPILDKAMQQDLWVSINGNTDDTVKNGLIHDDDGKYRVYENGEPVSITGYVEYEGGLFYVKDGVLDTSADGLVNDPARPDIWYFCSGGQAQLQYSGLAEYDGEWFYLADGILDTTSVGIVTYDGGRFIIAAGRILREVNGLIQDPTTGLWYYVAGGQVADYTGLALYDDHWFYVINGQLATDYTGTVMYNGSEFYVEGGQVVEKPIEKTSQYGYYILNVNPNSMKFHYPNCPSVKRMNVENRREFYGTRDEAIAMGFSPCQNCNP